MGILITTDASTNAPTPLFTLSTHELMPAPLPRGYGGGCRHDSRKAHPQLHLADPMANKKDNFMSGDDTGEVGIPARQLCHEKHDERRLTGCGQQT